MHKAARLRMHLTACAAGAAANCNEIHLIVNLFRRAFEIGSGLRGGLPLQERLEGQLTQCIDLE